MARRAMAGAVALTLLPAAGPSASMALDTDASSQVVITYRCRPADRPAFRDHLEQAGAARFESWRRRGSLAEYLLLFNAYVKEGAWDAMAVLSFDDARQLAQWMEIERGSPGGLSEEASRLAWPVATDLGREFRRTAGPSVAGDPLAAVYVVVANQHAGRRAYQDYVEAHHVPQFRGWLDSGALASFRVHVAADERAVPNALVVLEYRSLEALARRGPAVTRMRTALEAGNPGWRALDRIDGQVFREGDVVIADRIRAR